MPPVLKRYAVSGIRKPNILKTVKRLERGVVMIIEEIISRINGLPEGIRPKAASLIWWDKFSDQQTVHPYFREQMDKYDKEKETDDETVFKALLACGYSEKSAKKRSRTPELSHQ